MREASLQDVDQIIDWGCAFYEYGPWHDRVLFVEEDLRASIKAMIEGDNAAIFIDENGMCGGILYPMYFNLSHLVAQELFWWSDNGAAVREAFERWAIQRGASSMLMSCLADRHEGAMRRLMRSKGYSPVELSLWRPFEQQEQEKEAC